MGTPQGLSLWLDPTAGPHRVFPCVAPVHESMTHPNAWFHGHCSMAAPLGPPLWSPALVSVSVPCLVFIPGPQGCSGSWSLQLVPTFGPTTRPQTRFSDGVCTLGPHSWSPCLVPIPVPTPVPISAPHTGRALQAASLGATGPPTLSQSHPQAHHLYPRGTTPITAASPSHRGLGHLPQTPSLGQSLRSPRKFYPLPLPPFFSSPPVSNSFSSPVMRGLHGKLQQDAFVGRQSEWGRQFGALSAAAPPDPCWGDI